MVKHYVLAFYLPSSWQLLQQVCWSRVNIEPLRHHRVPQNIYKITQIYYICL